MKATFLTRTQDIAQIMWKVVKCTKFTRTYNIEKEDNIPNINKLLLIWASGNEGRELFETIQVTFKIENISRNNLQRLLNYAEIRGRQGKISIVPQDFAVARTTAFALKNRDMFDEDLLDRVEKAIEEIRQLQHELRNNPHVFQNASLLYLSGDLLDCVVTCGFSTFVMLVDDCEYDTYEIEQQLNLDEFRQTIKPIAVQMSEEVPWLRSVLVH